MHFLPGVKPACRRTVCSRREIRKNVSMPRAALIPHVRKVDVPEARQAIPHVHAYLRECILNGTLTPGTKLSQVTLAEQLGISRTPLREVLRMLQEEGLVENEPNQRTRVAGLDPEELDDVYASRILMETLALSMTIGHFGPAGRKDAKRLLAAMRRAAKTGDIDGRIAASSPQGRATRCSGSCGRWPTGRSGTSGSTSCPIRTAGRQPATSSMPRSWMR
jgi:DNA-binding transcriptional regulator YhcF (GntR family)